MASEDGWLTLGSTNEAQYGGTGVSEASGGRRGAGTSSRGGSRSVELGV